MSYRIGLGLPLTDVNSDVARFYYVFGQYCLVRGDEHLNGMDFLQTALSLSRGGTVHHQCDVLYIMALNKRASGDYTGSQIHAQEAETLAKISGNLFQQARMLSLDSASLASSGDYTRCLDLLVGARELLHLCGMSGGETDCQIMFKQAAYHYVKSEYDRAQI